MPPFSIDDNQARHYDNNNDVRSLTAEEKAFLHRENIDTEDVALEVSILVGKRTERRHHHHSYRHGEEEDYHNNENNEDDDDIECSDSGDIDFDGNFEATKLNLDLRVDAFECGESSQIEIEIETNPATESVTVQHSEPYFRCSGSSRKSSFGTRRRPLSTIPERRVAFAGTIVEGFVYVDLEVFVIPHVNEYTFDDKRRLWYTRKELSRMRKSCIQTARAVSRYIEMHMYCPFYFRGLENLIDPTTTVLFLPENCTNGGDSDGGETGDSSTSESRRWDGLEAVLDEQERQRFVSLEIQEGVLYFGMTNPEKVRSVYTTRGKTRKSQSIAHAYALCDEAHAKECLEENTNAKYDEYEYDDNGNCDCDYYQTNKELSNGVRWVFGRLLTPFLYIPQGDVYLAMGEEMI
jgi:hypothetical protein